MRRLARTFLLTALLIAPAAARAEDGASLNLPKVLESVRKTLSIPPSFQLEISSITPSPLPGLLRGVVELRTDQNQVRRETLFVSTDSRYYFFGNLYDTDMDMDALRRGMINLQDSASKGEADAPVKVVVYSDFQCEACRNAELTLKKEKFQEKYGNKVLWVYKNFPLVKHHNWALSASVAAMCVLEQKPKTFWKFHDYFFDHQNEIAADNLRAKSLALAQKSGLDVPKFTDCYDRQATQGRVQSEMAEGQSLGVFSTPTYVINGRVVAGFHGTDELKKVIAEFLR